MSYRMPPGSLLLAETATLVVRRMNGTAGHRMTDGITWGESLLALARAALQRPDLYRGEQASIEDLVEIVDISLIEFYDLSISWNNAVRPIPEGAGVAGERARELAAKEGFPDGGNPDRPGRASRTGGRKTLRARDLERTWDEDAVEKMTNHVPPGFKALMRRMAILYRERNNAMVPEGTILAEGLVAFTMDLQVHEFLYKPEKELIKWYSSELETTIRRFYTLNGISGIVISGVI